MEINETFARTRYATSVLEEASNTWLSELAKHCDSPSFVNLEIKVGRRALSYDKLEEFIAEHRRKFDSFTLTIASASGRYWLQIWQDNEYGTHVKLRAPDRDILLRLTDIFTREEEANLVPTPPKPPKLPAPKPSPPLVFIGHGHDTAWRDLKDHLHEHQGYEVEAFDSGARAGHTARDVLESMMARSSFALIVLTAEDQMADGGFHARQNVVHEIGLFQGRLGFKRAIAVVETGVELFSNLDGIQQIRFEKGNIRSTYGDVLATLRREFGPAPAS